MFAPSRTKAQIKKRRSAKQPEPEPYSTDDVLWHDVRDFLGKEWVDELLAKNEDREWDTPSGLRVQREHTLRVGAFTVSGELAERCEL
jgi:tRNA (uracil-5-)-methyltransferase